MVARLFLESLCARSGSSAAERDSLQYFFFIRAAQWQDLQEHPFCSGDALEGLSMPFLNYLFPAFTCGHRTGASNHSFGAMLGLAFWKLDLSCSFISTGLSETAPFLATK